MIAIKSADGGTEMMDKQLDRRALMLGLAGATLLPVIARASDDGQ